MFEQRFTFDDAELLAQIDALIARGGNLKPALDDIGQDMVTVTTRAFELGRSPGGEPWLPSAAAKREGRKTLIDRGLRGGLMGSFSYQVGESGVVYGTNVVYAAIHQFGGTIQPKGAHAVPVVLDDDRDLASAVVTLPARPFVGASDQDVRRWEDTMRDYLAGEPAGGAP
jgi:phage virion morphogenesis protein